jgi:cyclohexadienyl dehydratase
VSTRASVASAVPEELTAEGTGAGDPSEVGFTVSAGVLGQGRSDLPLPCSRISRCSRCPPWREILLLILVLAGSLPLFAPPASANPPLRIATSGDYAPFSYEEESGKLRGLDVEIAERLGQDLGVEIRFVRFAWPELESKLEHGDFDVAMSGVTMRPDRALIGLYTRPYASTGAVALVRAGGPIKSVRDLGRPATRLAVSAGGHLERVARSRFPKALLKPTTDNWSLAEQVKTGAADAAITDSAEVRQWLGPGLRTVGPFTYDHKAFLLPASQVQLAERVDAWLVEREQDGWLPSLRGRWLGEWAALNADAMARETVGALIELRLGLMPMVAAAKRGAALPIEDPAQEERVVGRARAQAGDAARHVEGVYRVLIEMAKSVQRQASATTPAQPLDRLRAAIGRVDQQLIGELRHLPQTPAFDWRFLLERNLRPLGIDGPQILRLAGALAAG